jgi:CRP/FNR family transcriptional regulator
VHQSWGEEKEFILRFAAAGSVVGHRGFGTATGFPVSATALEKTRACFITAGFLETALKANPSFCYSMMQLYAAELQKAEQRIHDLAVQPVRTRVADALFSIRESFGADSDGFIRIPITRLDIASYAGTTYEAVFRLMSEWSKAGAITTTGKKFKINNEYLLKN